MGLTEIKKTAITKGWLQQAEKYLYCCGEDRQPRKSLILRDLSEIFVAYFSRLLYTIIVSRFWAKCCSKSGKH